MIDLLQNYFGMAIRQNAGNLNELLLELLSFIVHHLQRTIHLVPTVGARSTRTKQMEQNCISQAQDCL
jgi:hypothetical protein